MAEKKFSLDDEPATQTLPATVPADVAAHADEIAQASPEVQQHAIDEHARQESTTQAEAEKDINGTAFDAKLHTGSKLKSGEWRKRKSVLGTPTPKKTADAKTGTVMTADQEGASRAAGAAAASMMFSSMTMLMGDEWHPRTEKAAGFDENKLMGQAFGDYFVAKGVTDFPPGVTLSFMMLGYISARMQMPKTRSKMQTFKTWCGIRYAAYKLKKEFKKKGIVAVVEIRDGVLTVDGKPNYPAK